MGTGAGGTSRRVQARGSEHGVGFRSSEQDRGTGR